MKNQTINDIIKREGGYANNPDDSGGETNFGITLKVARRYAFFGDLKDLPRELAFSIYSDEYWNSVRADSLLSLSKAICAEVVDTSINSGPHQASLFLQRALNVLNQKEIIYNDLKVDGNIGPATLKALAAYLATRDETILCRMLNVLQGAFLVDLAERREKDETFIYGWFKNRIVM